MESTIRIDRSIPGVRVVTEHLPWCHSAAVGVWVGSGSAAEGPGEHGAAHFLEHVLFKRTANASGRELSERIEQLTARNAKLLDTLKEARQQLIALREEVYRLGQPPSGYGVLIDVYDDETVDVFTSGRKRRLTLSPNVPGEGLQRGQSLRLNEALTVVEKSL